MAKQITILGRLGDAIMDTGQPTRDGTDDATITEIPHQVFVKEMKLEGAHEGLMLERLVEAQRDIVDSFANGKQNMPEAETASKAILARSRAGAS